MSTPVLIIGESGSGKSTSIRNLDPKETFIINVLDKPLPFKGWKKMYHNPSEDKTAKCNMFSSDNAKKIITIIKKINDNLPEIKNIIIDDFQYVMANEFMNRSMERGYDKFTEIAKNAWSIINEAVNCRSNIVFYFLSHSDVDINGKTKCKTIGKMLDDKITIEGMFTIVLNSLVTENGYLFLTQSTDKYSAKSPMEMFDTKTIPNDLKFVSDKINEYFNEDIQTEEKS